MKSMASLRRRVEAIELQNAEKWSDKMCDEDYDLTSLTDGELHAEIKKIESTLRVTSLIISDGGRKLRRFLLKHLREETRREDQDKILRVKDRTAQTSHTKVSITLEIPKDRFLTLQEKGLITIYKEEVKKAHFLSQDRNNPNEKEMDVPKDYTKTHNMTKPEKKRKAVPTVKESS